MRTARRLWAQVQHPVELIVLVSYLVGGLTMIGSVPSSVRDALGEGFHQAWVVMLVAGPAVAACGVWWRDQWVGAWLRIAGTSSVLGALSAYWVSMAIAFGPGTFTGVIFAGLILATVYIIARDALLLIRAARKAKRGRT
jgi:hypothetical protein